MSQQSKEFVDPVLKRAVRQAYSAERAPESLRLRVIAAIDQVADSGSADRPRKPVKTQPVWLKYATAALVLLAIGAGVEYWLLHDSEPAYDPSSPGQFVYTLPQDFQEGMTTAYARAVPTTLTERANAEATLTKTIGHKVIAPDIAGWTFVAAEEVSIANHPAARMVYTRGAQTISLFSIIADASYPPPDGTSYDETCSGVIFAGVVRNGMIYCVFSNYTDPQTSAELRTIRDTFAKNL
jgi:hypothetical protein